MKMLLTSTQDNIKKVLGQYLKEKYKKVTITNDFIIAEGNIPIALAAHMDTVFESEIASLKTKYGELLYDTDKNIMHCVGFGGFDDKAGIFAILQIIQSGLRPHIILSTDEERGCVGASVLAKMDCPFKDLRYIVQLDRRGSKDCVFYDYDTEVGKDFVEYIESFGFAEAYGTFTDITEYCPSWGIAGVNLSVGYYNEHTNCEVLYVDILMATIKKVTAMLRKSEIPFFAYIESPYLYSNWKRAYGWSWDAQTGKATGAGPGPVKAASKYTCSCCKTTDLLEAEVFPVVGTDDSTKFFCADCLTDNVNWCTICYEAYEYDAAFEKEDPDYICPYCRQLRGNP